QSPQAFIDDVLLRGLNARYVLVGDDFRFGARRAGDYAMLDAAGDAAGFDVARMLSYEVHGLRVSSSAVREALAGGDMALAASLLGRPYSISGHIVHGAKLGRELGAARPGAGDGFRTLNLRFPHPRPAASGIFVVQVQGLGPQTLDGVASLGVRPTLGEAGRVLLETHCFDWPQDLGAEGAYGRLVRVELLHKLHEERRYGSLAELTAGIARDAIDARSFLAGHAAERRQTTRDRI
ncbi:bifunctional riboflavin kinase/FAD synthetase, partial [Methylibium sp.]|uniref:bifunctional riboflavin kinase/FAD synthetase n=1 Tax=Methylibium sp. TaxID=2067992 RepID=UPI0017C03D59